MITVANGTTLSAAADLSSVIRSTGVGKALHLTVVRGTQTLQLTATLTARVSA